jgi:predicted transcriptional regulator
LSDKDASNYEAVANIIKNKLTITQDEIRQETSLSKGAVSQIFQKLRAEGLIIVSKKKRERKTLYQWVGGVSAIEDELQSATTRHISASLLAETYDLFVTDAYALYSQYYLMVMGGKLC